MLRTVLRLDAAVTGLNRPGLPGAGRAAGGPARPGAGLTRPLGAFLVVFAAFLWALAARPAPARAAVLAFACANLV